MEKNYLTFASRCRKLATIAMNPGFAFAMPINHTHFMQLGMCMQVMHMINNLKHWCAVYALQALVDSGKVLALELAGYLVSK